MKNILNKIIASATVIVLLTVALVPAKTIFAAMADDSMEIISNTADNDWSGICLLTMTYPDGEEAKGTGFVVSDNTIVTAAHCLYHASNGGYAKTVKVEIGKKNVLFFGYEYIATTKDLNVSDEYISIDDYQDKSYKDAGGEGYVYGGYNAMPYDFASISVPDLPNNITRYEMAEPAVDKGNAEVVWYDAMPGILIKSETEYEKNKNDGILEYHAANKTGSSGSPVFADIDGKLKVIGVHISADPSKNVQIGTILSVDKIEQIEK